MLSRKQAIDFLVKHPEEFGHMLGFDDLSDIHRQWMNLMFSSKEDKTLQAHRNSYKTTCVSLNLARTMILKPNLRILFMRKTDDDVKEVIKQVKKIITHPKVIYLIQCIHGINLKLTVDNATELSTNLTNDVKGTSQLVGMGIGSSITGQHYDVIYTDDIVTIKDRTSRAEREQVKVLYDELQNIKKKGSGRIFNTGTPWHKDDAFTKMPEPMKWDCYSTGIFDEDELQALREKMSPSLFAANYELRHIASEDVIFENPTLNGDQVKVQQAKFCHVDAAYGGEDYTAFTICRKVGGQYYVYGRLWHKAVDLCIPEIQDERRKFNAGLIICEENGDKGYLAKELRRHGEKVSTYWEDMNKYIKIVTYLKSEWRNVVFVSGTDQEYIDMILEYNEYAEHDDAPDSLASIIRKLWNRKNEDENISAFGF